MYSKVQVFFNSSEAALLSVGLLYEYGSVDDLKLVAAEDQELLPFADLAVDIERQLQSRVDDFKFLGHKSDVRFEIDPNSDEGFFTREHLKEFLLSANRRDLIENIEKLDSFGDEKRLNPRRESTLLKIIGALAYELAAREPGLLDDSGNPFVGYAKSTGERGLVGLLFQSNRSELSGSALQADISAGVKEIRSL
jgi:hypothetical protein|tara:strand:- start:2179 stop:2763 length:585 start_codon:yes stop_codon:yes gene_type:complete